MGRGHPTHLEQQEVVPVVVDVAAGVGDLRAHPVQALVGLWLGQRVGSQQDLEELPVPAGGAGWGAQHHCGGARHGGGRGLTERPPPRELAAPPGSRSPCPAATVGTLALPPRHSRPLGAVRGAQHPLLGDEEAPADVLPVQLQRGHVRPQVGPGLVAPQDPSPGLRCGGRERSRMSWGAQHCRAPSRVPPTRGC